MLFIFNRSRVNFIFLFLFSIILISCNRPITVSEDRSDQLSPTETNGEISDNQYLPMVIQPYSTYYVSKTGKNTNGRSWATAWNELDQINWEVIKPGDTIQIDGGQTEMIYTTTLRVEKSGTTDLPIKIQLSDQSGRDGRIVIFGGRSTHLPDCGQIGYFFETDGVRDEAILLENVSWITIDGLKWSGITIYGHNRDGIRLRHGPNNIVIRNIEIYDNGWAKFHNNKWEPDGPGINFSGTNITFERIIAHDNGQDAFQSGGGNSNFTLRQSWLYNGRIDETGKFSFNYCSHPDGIQIYDGGVQSGFIIEESIIGPGFMQGVILGQSRTDDGQWAKINDVTFKNDVFTKAANNNVFGYPKTKPTGWVLDHVTIHCPNTTGQCLSFENPDHSVTNTIIHSGRIYLPDGLDNYSGNCQWETMGFTLGEIEDPLFTNIQSDPFSLDDYSIIPGSPCAGKGSLLTSVDQLLNMQDIK